MIALMLGVVTLVACNDPVDPTVSFKDKTVTLQVGQTYDVEVTVTEGFEVEYTIADPTVISFANGKVTALKVGSTTVTVTVKNTDVKDTLTVTVTEAPNPNVPVTSITLAGNTTGVVGGTITLTATILPANATDKTLTWSTSNASVATVANGVVTLVGAGTVTITAKNGLVTATHTITVSLPTVPTTSIEVSGQTTGLVGQTLTLTATVLPENASDKTVTWKTSDVMLATVTDGVVTLLKAGTVTITASQGNITKTHIITITDPVVLVTSVEITGEQVGVIGGTITLTATVLPENATDKTITWSSSDPTIATVNSGVVSLLKAGVVTITAKSGSVEDTISITVEEPQTIIVESIELSGSHSGVAGETITLTATVLPENATDKTITWSSSDETVATVNNGVVTLVKAGTVIITASHGEIAVEHEIEITGPEVLATIGQTTYPTFEAALAAAQSGDVILLETQEITQNFTMKSGVTLKSQVGATVIFKGVITLPTGTVNVTFDGLEFTAGAYISGPGSVDNFTFINNYVHDSTLPKTAFAPSNRIDVNAFIRFYTASGAQIIGTLTIDSNTFENMTSDIIAFSRTTNNKTVTITNNEFRNFPNSAIRVDGGYNAGTYIIRNNLFIHETPGENVNAILFRAYSADTGQQQFIYIEENTFINMGIVGGAISDDYGSAGTILFSTYNDRHSEIWIRYNTFEGGANAIHYRNRPAASAVLIGHFNFNTFNNVAGYYLYEAAGGSVKNDSDFNDNLFIDENGNEITDPEILSTKILNLLAPYRVFEKPIDLFLGIHVPKVKTPTFYVDPNLDDDIGEHVGAIGQSFQNGITAFKTIQEAIDHATPGTAIYVGPFTFAENFTVNKDDIMLLGANYNVDIFNETRTTETVLTGQITIENNVKNTTLNGFTLSGSARVTTPGQIDGLFFNYNKVLSSLTFISGSNPEGVIKLVGLTNTTVSKNVYVLNSEFKYTGSSAPRALMASNIENVYVVNNYFESSFGSFTDVIRITGTNYSNETGVGLTGDLFVYSNTFKDAGQAAIFITKYSNLDARIVNNDFQNIRTTAVRIRFQADTAVTKSTILFNFNKADLQTTSVAGDYIYSALRVEQAKPGTQIIANYNHLINIPFSYYFSAPSDANFDARYNFYASEVDFVPTLAKLVNVDMYEGYYTSLEALPKYNEKLIIPMAEVQITNKITELIELEEYQLQVTFGPENATNKKLVYTSSDETVATVDATGKVFAKNAGLVTITVKSEANPEVLDTMELEVLARERVEVTFEGTPSVLIGETFQLTAIKYGTDKAITFETNNPEILTIDENGLITALSEGIAVVTVKLGDDPAFELEVTVYAEELHELLQYFVNHNLGIIEAQTIKYIGSDDGSLDYDHLIAESVSPYLFSGMTITRNMIPTTNANYRSTEIQKLEWIVIHDTANTSAGAGGQANSNWATNPTNTSSSWHYTVGNDGFYQQIENNLIGLHAGDGSVQTIFDPTGIVATRMFPLVEINAEGYFTIDGVATTILAPMKADNSRATNADISDMGIRAVVADDGTYHLPRMYQNSNFGRKIGMRGGNQNGIGIEMAVNRGSDVWLTWQRTAKLAAKLLVENDLRLDRLVFHNHFSGKACPRTMLESGNLEKFYMMVEAEYNMLKNYSGYTISLTSNNPAILNNQGRIISVPAEDTVVTYTITVITPTNDTYSITLSTVVRGVV
ncbi:N-acetylmuramoyl-L-alanine amidase CwlH precursor [Acholeplasma hippikon]|uniref:N-acetylmuramoyl-L-alanine amidase n=2 Tax=Acholeplasma hippikon TaxID=264636 RepID=A0A449BJY2_9MOLU|nr:N-acetylmuramoyl-L-alanine amidase CwlH precursor [Acholeplasma hippikon]